MRFPRERRTRAAGASTRSESVTVPNFWDPRARIERPSAEAIGAIRFLTTDDFPPFAFRDRRGILVGFDIDLAQAICAVLKVQCAIQVRPFETLVDGLKDGTGNAIIAGFDLEKAPAEGLIASQAYLKIPGRFVVRKDKSLRPRPAGAGRASSASSAARRMPPISTRFFPDLHVACFMRPAVPLAELKDGNDRRGLRRCAQPLLLAERPAIGGLLPLRGRRLSRRPLFRRRARDRHEGGGPRS